MNKEIDSEFEVENEFVEVEFRKLNNLVEFMHDDEWYTKAGNEAISNLTGDYFKPKRDLKVKICIIDNIYD